MLMVLFVSTIHSIRLRIVSETSSLWIALWLHLSLERHVFVASTTAEFIYKSPLSPRLRPPTGPLLFLISGLAISRNDLLLRSNATPANRNLMLLPGSCGDPLSVAHSVNLEPLSFSGRLAPGPAQITVGSIQSLLIRSVSGMPVTIRLSFTVSARASQDT